MPTCKQIILQDSCNVRQTQLRCEKLGVSLRDVNLNQTDLLVLLPLELSKMCFNDRLLGLRKIAVLLYEVAGGKLPLIVLPASCIISCVKPYYFRSAFRSAFQRSGFHGCPCRWYRYPRCHEDQHCYNVASTTFVHGGPAGECRERARIKR